MLRYWGNRFPEVSPTIGRGSRRLYTPRDVALLAGLKKLLRDDGMTIRGAQKILDQRGKEYVASLAETDSALSNRSRKSGSVQGSPSVSSQLEAGGGHPVPAEESGGSEENGRDAAQKDETSSSGARAENARKLNNEIQSLRKRLAEKIN